MRLTISLLCLSIFLSCKKDESNPVIPPPAPVYVQLHPYMEYLDSLYVKVWSDSSWEKYDGLDTIGGVVYMVLTSNNRIRYYYGPLGYSGFTMFGDTLILFDKPIAAWPDSLALRDHIVRSTTFVYRGYQYTMTLTNTLTALQPAATPFGIFDSCACFEFNSTLSVGEQSQSTFGQSWHARGPGQVKQTDNSGMSIVMVRGHVNGKSWGFGSGSPAELTSKPDLLEILNRGVQWR